MDKELLIDWFGESWYNELKPLLHSGYFHDLGLQLKKERQSYIIYPETNKDIFKAFKVTPFDKVKGVILGQDPYADGSYDGLCFSNSLKAKASPSLKNILREVYSDIKPQKPPDISDLSLYRWAEQGLLMINATLTVRKYEPDSHHNLWINFTKYVITTLSKKQDVIWMLWGNRAQEYIPLISTNKSHALILTSHPSPLGAHQGKRPFIGSKCFSQFNEELNARNIKEIVW